MRISGSVRFVSVALALVLLVGFAAGVAVHAWLNRELPIQFSHPRSPVADSTLETSTISPTFSQQDLTNTLDPIYHVLSVQDSTNYASDFDQSASLYLLLARADRSALNRYINESFSISPRNQRNAALAVIFSRYAAIDPKEALERVLALTQVTMQERSNVIRSVFTEWTVGDLEDAVGALENLPEPYKYAATSAIIWRSDFLTHDQRIQLAEQIGPNDPWIHGTVTSLRAEAANADPRSAFHDHISDKIHTQKNYAELFGIVTHWIERDGVATLLEIHDALDNRDARRSVMQGLIWNAITTNSATPIEVLNVVSELPNNQDARQTMEHVFRAWASLDPKQSFEASLEFTDQRLTHTFRSSILRTWASKDADGLLTEASTLPREYRNTAVIDALGKMSRDAPEAAIQFARNLDPQSLRSQAREAIIQEWSEVDAKSAFEWYMNDSFNDDAREDYSIFWGAFSSYLDQNLESAERYADEYQGESKNRLIEAVARYLSVADPDRAIEYVPKVRESARQSLQFSIGLEMAKTRPLDALDYGELISEDRHDQYYGQLLGRWARRDFFSLHENIQKVQQAYRGHAARDLLRVNEQKSYLSVREVRALEDIVSSAPPIVPSGE